MCWVSDRIYKYTHVSYHALTYGDRWFWDADEKQKIESESQVDLVRFNAFAIRTFRYSWWRLLVKLTSSVLVVSRLKLADMSVSKFRFEAGRTPSTINRVWINYNTFSSAMRQNVESVPFISNDAFTLLLLSLCYRSVALTFWSTPTLMHLPSNTFLAKHFIYIFFSECGCCRRRLLHISICIRKQFSYRVGRQCTCAIRTTENPTQTISFANGIPK